MTPAPTGSWACPWGRGWLRTWPARPCGVPATPDHPSARSCTPTEAASFDPAPLPPRCVLLVCNLDRPGGLRCPQHGDGVLLRPAAKEPPAPTPLEYPRATTPGDPDLEPMRLPPALPASRPRQTHPDRVQKDPQLSRSSLTERDDQKSGQP